MTNSQLDSGIELLKDIETSENFVAIGMTLERFGESIEGFHSALIICLQNKLHILHFTSKEVLFEILDEPKEIAKYLIKKIEYFNSEESEIISFKSFCIKVRDNSNLKYGFVFDGGFYNSTTGKHFSESEFPEISTCVGFCINVLTGWIYDIEKYFEYEDWELLPLTNPSFTNQFEKAKLVYPNLSENDYKKHHRRISPDELTLSGYYEVEDMALRKNLIDEYIVIFKELLEKRV